MRQFFQWQACLSLDGLLAMEGRNVMEWGCMTLVTKKRISQDKYIVK